MKNVQRLVSFPLLMAGLVLALPMLGGCGADPNAVPGHTADEQKAVDELKTLTPQQQIERLEKGPMPEAAKKAQIEKIKRENNLP